MIGNKLKVLEQIEKRSTYYDWKRYIREIFNLSENTLPLLIMIGDDDTDTFVKYLFEAALFSTYLL